MHEREGHTATLEQTLEETWKHSTPDAYREEVGHQFEQRTMEAHITFERAMYVLTRVREELIRLAKEKSPNLDRDKALQRLLEKNGVKIMDQFFFFYSNPTRDNAIPEENELEKIYETAKSEGMLPDTNPKEHEVEDEESRHLLTIAHLATEDVIRKLAIPEVRRLLKPLLEQLISDEEIYVEGMNPDDVYAWSEEERIPKKEKSLNKRGF